MGGNRESSSGNHNAYKKLVHIIYKGKYYIKCEKSARIHMTLSKTNLDWKRSQHEQHTLGDRRPSEYPSKG